ncbi:MULTISPECIES: hypothetical protein [Sphingomonas]|uniref:Uncharacterized protein n=1 Tax=Sphingomonas molluscorum TaxID=418184 RepID=A0ABU8QAN1_9SPHN|nr:hypothetical protein [Sphingomonas sp. JUb134]
MRHAKRCGYGLERDRGGSILDEDLPGCSDRLGATLVRMSPTTSRGGHPYCHE